MRRIVSFESYIVRIYRRGDGGEVTGLLEAPPSRRTKAFHSLAELAEMLRRPRRERSSSKSERREP